MATSTKQTQEEASASLTVETPVLTGETLKRLRQELGLTQREFASYVNLPPGTIATWERRNDDPLTAPAAVIVKVVDQKTAKARHELRNILAEGL